MFDFFNGGFLDTPLGSTLSHLFHSLVTMLSIHFHRHLSIRKMEDKEVKEKQEEVEEEEEGEGVTEGVCKYFLESTSLLLTS